MAQRKALERRATASAIPRDQREWTARIGQRSVKLTNLDKIFWPEEGYTKGDLLRYYLSVANAILPHIKRRAMVMKRYPNGIAGEHFFMKRTPAHAPEWLTTCSIEHDSGNVIDFPVVDDAAALLWVVNLGCIDLNPWYARCDDVDRPDWLHFDLDPVVGASFGNVREAALLVYRALAGLGAQASAKTTGSRGIHVYVPIRRGPTQKEVWTVAKSFAQSLAALEPGLLTAEYRIEKRPPGRVLVDYNQNAWGRTLASVYSVRPRPGAPVSTPVTWDELEAGIEIEDFRIDNLPARIEKLGDLWAPLLGRTGRFRLEQLLDS